MSDTFFAYLRKERDRLDGALAKAQAVRPPDQTLIASLRQQQHIVDDQLRRWTEDLSQELIAA